MAWDYEMPPFGSPMGAASGRDYYERRPRVEQGDMVLTPDNREGLVDSVGGGGDTRVMTQDGLFYYPAHTLRRVGSTMTEPLRASTSKPLRMLNMPDLPDDYQFPALDDAVIVTSASDEDFKGQLGKVIIDDTTINPGLDYLRYRVRMHNGKEDWMYPYEVEKVEMETSREEPYILVGDRIRIRQPDSGASCDYLGERGIVIEEDEKTSGVWKVQLDNRTTSHRFGAEFLKRIKRSADPHSLTSKIKRGEADELPGKSGVPRVTQEQIKQYLNTDLGIDKEYVQRLMLNNIEEKVDRVIDQMFTDGRMDSLIEKHVMEHIKQNVLPGTKAVDFLSTLAVKLMKEEITKKLDFGSIGVYFTPNSEKA